MAGKEGDEEDKVGANRYLRVKFSMDPTTRVENTKSSSLRPKLGREAMSPRTQAVTPTNSSIRTLKANCGSAATLDLHPFKNKPNIPNPPEDLDDEESSPEPFPSPPPPPLPPPRPIQLCRRCLRRQRQ
nr:hypothetical protein CFP56_78458 [Quercus suber]